MQRASQRCKDEIIRLDAFQRTVGTSANVAKAKEAIKSIKGLETRRYTPRKLSQLFENRVVKMPTSGEKTHKEMDLVKVCCLKMAVKGRRQRIWIWCVEIQLLMEKIMTGWHLLCSRRSFIEIVNIKVDIEETQQEIADLMDEIDSSNCNVTQGYKLFKRLKELRIQRKEKEKELHCLYILTEHFDMSAMANECESNAYELERLLYPEETVDECDETQISEGDADAETISKAE